MALARAVDAIGPVQAGVEPLRASSARPSAWPACSAARRRRRARPPRCRNSRPSSPNRSRCRRAGRTPAWRRSRRPIALASRAARRAPPRRGPSATARRGRSLPRPSSAAPARRPCGNISGRGRRRRPGSSCAGTSMLSSAKHHRAVGIADLARASPELDGRVGRLALPWCSAARSALLSLAPNCWAAVVPPTISHAGVMSTRLPRRSCSTPPHLSPVL